MSHPVGDKTSLKEAWSWSRNHFTPHETFFERLSYRLQILCTVWPREVLTFRWQTVCVLCTMFCSFCVWLFVRLFYAWCLFLSATSFLVKKLNRNCPISGHGHGRVTNFTILHHMKFSERLKLQTSNFLHGFVTESTNRQMSLRWAWSGPCDAF